MENITAIIIAVLTSSTVSAALVSGFVNFLERRRNRKDNTAAGLRILLYDRIKHLAKSYIERGNITAEELEDLMQMHKVYHDLGGNGYLDKLMDQVHRLQVIA